MDGRRPTPDRSYLRADHRRWSAGARQATTRTAIIGLTIGDAPALLGDVLLTSNGPSDAKLRTPTLENVNEYFGSTLYAHVPTLRQKVNILSDKVIVSWSG